MLPRAAILALVAAVACALQITAAQRVPDEDARAPLKEYTKERDKKYDEDFMPKKSGFTYDWIEDIIWQEKKNLETTIKLQTKYPTGAVIRYFKTAEVLFTLMYKRVKATRDFIEMANRDVFWYHAEKKLNTTRKKLDSAVKRCNGAEATEGITRYINDLKNKARRCSLELVARAEVNEREFEFVARALNKIYWKVEGCIGDAVRIDKPVTAHLRKRRSFLKLFKKMGKKFIEISLPFLAGTAAGDAMQYGLSWLNGGDDAQKEKKCIDTNILDNTRINTQMLLYRAHDAIDLVNAAWLMEDTTININNDKLEVKPMQVCVRRKVEKLADLNKFRAVLENCGISEESVFTPDPKEEPVIPQYSKEDEETDTDGEDEEDDDVSFESEIGSPLDLEVGPAYEVYKR